MITKAFLNLVTGHGDNICHLWIKKIRASENMKHYVSMSDNELLEKSKVILTLLARWLELEASKNEIGSSFVKLGKSCFDVKMPVSELIFAINLARKSVVEYILQENEMNDAASMYMAVDLISRIAEFFQLGTYYIIKGFLESVYKNLQKNESLNDSILKNYFSDDFFFK